MKSEKILPNLDPGIYVKIFGGDDCILLEGMHPPGFAPLHFMHVNTVKLRSFATGIFREFVKIREKPV